MRYCFFLQFVLLFQSCISDDNSVLDNKRVVVRSDYEITPLIVSDIPKVFSIPVGIAIPIPICTNDSSILIYDYGDALIKHITEREIVSFSPLGSADNKLGGAFYRSIGFSTNSNELLISSEIGVQSFTLSSKVFGEYLDNYEHCSSFSNRFAQIVSFSLPESEDIYIVTQNGIPCINNPREGKFYLDEFMAIRFLKIKSLKDGRQNYTFSIPIENEIIKDSKLFGRIKPFISYNKNNQRFYAVINPTKQLYEFRFDPKKLELEQTRVWNMNLPFTNLPIDYTLNNGINREIVGKVLKYNFEYQQIKAVGKYVIISYDPSKSTEFKEIENAKYPNHSLLAIINLEEADANIFSLDYNEVNFLGCLDNGELWFYNLADSENSNIIETQIHKINIDSLLR